MTTGPGTEPAGASPKPASPPPLWRRMVRIAWVLAVVSAVIYVLVQEGPAIREAVAEVGPARVAASGLAALCAVVLSVTVWRPLLAGLGGDIPPLPAARVLLVSQTGKYLPGSVWPALAQIELTRAWGVRPAAAFGGFAVFVWVHLFTAVAFAVVTLPAIGAAPLWVLVGAPLAIVACTPVLIDRAGQLAARLTRRDPLPALPVAAVAVAMAWSVPMWLVYGVHIWLLVAPLGGGLALSVGAFTAAYTAGFVVVFAPAGAGVRDGVLVAILVASGVAAPAALAVALASRVLLVVADVGAAGMAAAAGRPRGGVTAGSD